MSYASIELEGIHQLSLQLVGEPQKLLHCAKTGSLISLHALASSMKSKAFPSRLLPKAVDLLASTLRQHRRRPFEHDVVPVCVTGLAALGDGFFTSRKALSQKVMHCWPMVWDWIEQAGNDILASELCDRRFLEAIENALKVFSACGRVMEEDGVLTLATRIWLCRNGNFNFSRQLARPAFAIISHEAIRSSAQSKMPITLLDRVYQKAMALGWSTDSLVDIAMRRLRTLPQMSALNEHTLLKTLDGVHHLLKSLLVMSSGAHDNAHTKFLKSGGIRRFLCLFRNIISLLESTTISGSLALKSASTFSFGLWVFSYIFRCTPGISLIYQAIKHGLFGVLESAMPHLHILRRASYSGEEAIEFLLSQVLPQAFVFRSVVVTAHRYMRKWLGACGGVCCGCGLPDSLVDCEMRDSWEKTLYTLRHQVSAYRFFSQCLRKEVVSCGNPSCDAQGERSTFRKCAGCQTALFCSSACQRLAWEIHHHKEECAQTHQRLASSGLSASDAHYLSLVAHEDIRHALHEVVFHSRSREDQRIQKLFLPSRRGFTINYTKLSSEVHQFSFDDRPSLDLSAPYPTIYTMGDTKSSGRAEDEDEHTPGYGDVEPHETLRTTLEVVFPFGSETRSLYISAEFSGRAYHGYECTCCRFHGEDTTKDTNSSCSAHKEIS